MLRRSLTKSVGGMDDDIAGGVFFGMGGVPSLLSAEEAAFQVHLPPCQPDLIIFSIALPHRHLIQKAALCEARLFVCYSSPA